MESLEQIVAHVIENSDMALVCYIDESECPVTKAMLKPREREGIKTFWFTTNTSSNKVKCYKKNNKASIYFVDHRNFCGINLIGEMEVLETAEAKQRIWREGDEMYYPAGVTDSDYCVLRFTALRGRYYSNFHSDNFEIK
jgi:Uncharacterized stress protein (general stress protein 26)